MKKKSFSTMPEMYDSYLDTVQNIKDEMCDLSLLMAGVEMLICIVEKCLLQSIKTDL